MKKARSSIYLLILLISLMGCSRNKNVIEDALVLEANDTLLADDFGGDLAGWKQQTGAWSIVENALRQTSTSDSYPLILRTDKQFSDLDLSVEFRPISGRTDASGGVVFRAQDKDNYYIVRANALEGNFRLYTFKNGNRHQIASASVAAPALGEYHQIRIVAVGDHIQAYLNGELLLDHHDASFTTGYTGLWTKADSVTDFTDFQVRGKK